MKTASDFLAERQVRAGETLSKLNNAQIKALMGDEREMEMLDFRDRDELIILGLARRVRPDEDHKYWRTWVTVTGLMVRAMFEISDEPDQAEA